MNEPDSFSSAVHFYLSGVDGATAAHREMIRMKELLPDDFPLFDEAMKTAKSSGGTFHWSRDSFPELQARCNDWLEELESTIKMSTHPQSVFDASVKSLHDTIFQGHPIATAGMWNNMLSSPSIEDRMMNIIKQCIQLLPTEIMNENTHQSSTFLVRHGKSVFDSSTMKVGRRTPNMNTTEGIELAQKVAKEFSAKLRKFLDDNSKIHDNFPGSIDAYVSQSPNTQELTEIFFEELKKVRIELARALYHPICDSQDFGVHTGILKEDEKIVLDPWGKGAASILKHPLYMYPAGDIFLAFWSRFLNELRALSSRKGMRILFTHSSTLQALLMGFNVRKDHLKEDVGALRSFKENQTSTIVIESDGSSFSPYKAFTGTTNAT